MTITLRVHGLDCADEAAELREALQSRSGVRELSFDLLRGRIAAVRRETAVGCPRCVRSFVLDIGGEGRNPGAWNLNPRRVKTIGPHAGQRIPRLILGRAEAIPLSDASVSAIIMERTPLRLESLYEIRRIAAPDAVILLRHARPGWSDPHQLAVSVIGSPVRQRPYRIGRQVVQETVFRQGVRHDGFQVSDSRDGLCGRNGCVVGSIQKCQ